MTLIPRTLSALLAASAMLAAGAAHAEYPERPVNMVVPFAAGGPTDNVARSLAEAMRHSLGQTVVVENKGARAARSAPRKWPARSPTAIPCC